jgi:hypothetical protein
MDQVSKTYHHLSLQDPPKFCPNLDFRLENKLSGNPGSGRGFAGPSSTFSPSFSVLQDI